MRECARSIRVFVARIRGRSGQNGKSQLSAVSGILDLELLAAMTLI
jgi:hypothetical protein